jgi:hypothetical protein
MSCAPPSVACDDRRREDHLPQLLGKAFLTWSIQKPRRDQPRIRRRFGVHRHIDLRGRRAQARCSYNETDIDRLDRDYARWRL